MAGVREAEEAFRLVAGMISVSWCFCVCRWRSPQCGVDELFFFFLPTSACSGRKRAVGGREGGSIGGGGSWGVATWSTGVGGVEEDGSMDGPLQTPRFQAGRTDTRCTRDPFWCNEVVAVSPSSSSKKSRGALQCSSISVNLLLCPNAVAFVLQASWSKLPPVQRSAHDPLTRGCTWILTALALAMAAAPPGGLQDKRKQDP